MNMDNATNMNVNTRQSFEAYVAKAEELLEQNGKMPTYGSLRMAMGGVGSSTTLRDAISAVKAKLENQGQKKADYQDAPEEFTESLLEDFTLMLGSIWRKANEIAESQLAAARAAIDAERKEWEAERSQLDQVIDDLGVELQDAKNDIAAKQEQLVATDEKLATLSDEKFDLNAKLSASEAVAEERKLTIGKLEGQIEALKTQVEEAKKVEGKLAEVRSERDVLQTKFSSTEESLKSARAEAEDLKAKLEAKQKEVNSAIAAQAKSEATAEAKAEQLEKLEALLKEGNSKSAPVKTSKISK